MPFPFIPLALAGLSALGGRGQGRNRQNSESSSSSTSNVERTGTSSGEFETTSTQGFAPGFEGVSQDVLQGIFSRFGDTTFDPEELNRQELIEKTRVNRFADRFFGGATRNALASGTGNSAAGGALSRGLAEGFRGSGLSSVASDFSNRRFQLPAQQEALNAGQRASLSRIFGLLPRSTTNSGTNTNTTESTQVGETTGETTGSVNSQAGSPLANVIAGGIGGFGAAGGFNNIPGLSNIFGSAQGTNAFNVPQIQAPPPRPALNPAGFEIPNIARTPNFNPNIGRGF